MAWCETYKPLNWILFRGEAFTAFAPCERFQIRARPVRKDRRTADQVTSRQFLKNAKQQWSTLSDADKNAWNESRSGPMQPNKRELLVKRRGIDAFVRASIILQTAGLDPKPGLPDGNRLPSMPEGLDLLPGADARELVFRVRHQYSANGGYALQVRMTPTVTVASRTPYKTALRHVRHLGEGSVVPLPESGGIVRIPDTRFELEPGRMYAVEVRIVRLSDGGISLPRYTAAVREQETAAAAAVAPEMTALTELTALTATAATSAASPSIMSITSIPSSESAPRAATAPPPASTPLPATAQAPAASTETDRLAGLSVETIAPDQWNNLTGTDQNQLIRKAELRALADQHGSRHFPSYYVLNRYFNKTEKAKARPFGGPSIFKLLSDNRDITR